MRKLFYLLTACVAVGLTGCDDEAGPDGNYGEEVPVYFELGTISLLSDPTEVYPLTIDPNAKTDTTYIYSYTERDTVFDADGEPEILPDGSLNVTETVIEYEGPITARYYVYEPVVVKSEMAEYMVTLNSNSRWTVGKLIGSAVSCPKLSGGGDGYTQFKLNLNRSTTSRRRSIAYIYSNDSTVMHKLTFEQKKKGE